MDPTLIVVTIGSFLAAFVNAAFATGGVYLLLFTSLLVLPLSAAIPLQSAFSAASLVSRIVFFFAHIKWPIVIAFTAGCSLGVYFGALSFVSLPEAIISLMLGVLLLILIWAPTPKLGWSLKQPFFFIGIGHSYLATLFGVGGIMQPLIIRTQLTKLQITGTLAAGMLALDAMKVVGYVGFGFDYFDYLPHILLATIAGFAGAWAGKRVAHKVSEAQFRIVFKWIITIAAVRLIYLGATGLSLFSP